MNQNIIEWIIENKFADNMFRASAIANGLHLTDPLHDLEAQQARVKLYRDWRNSGVFAKHDTASCFAKAICGEPAPKPLIAGTLHSEAAPADAQP